MGAQPFLWRRTSLKEGENLVFPARQTEAPLHLTLDGHTEVRQLDQYSQWIRVWPRGNGHRSLPGDGLLLVRNVRTSYACTLLNNTNSVNKRLCRGIR